MRCAKDSRNIMATYHNAEDQFVTVNGERYAFRLLGPSRGIPLVMIMGFRCVMPSRSNHRYQS